jgi:hypothetical protein
MADGFWFMSAVAVVLYARMIAEIRQELQGQ